MNQVQKLIDSTPITSPADKFYNFFKNDMSNLVNIIPDSFKAVQLVQGEEGSVGAVNRWSYVLGGITISVDLETTVIDDANRLIRFKAIKGDVLLMYKSYEFSIAVQDGLVEWTIYYENATPLTPPPVAYATFAIFTSKAVDAYLLLH